MTRDRAIKVLREMKNLTYVATDSRCSAIDLAIESLSAEPCKSAEQNVADVPNGDEYVPNKACFDCMERGTGFCKGTIQEQSWCPIVAKANTEPSGDLISRPLLIGAIEKCGEEKIYPQALIQTINALPNAEPSGDLISREDAIAYIDRVTNSGLGKNKSLDYIRKYISALSSADRPKGEWIDREDSTDMFFLYRYECSVCGGKNVFNSSYCPNCGAHMR